MFKKFKTLNRRQPVIKKEFKSYYLNQTPSNTKLTEANYASLVLNGYNSNVIANKCINMIAQCVSSVEYDVFNLNTNELIDNSNLENAIGNSNQNNGTDFIQSIVRSLMMSGNCYISCVKNYLGLIENFSILRPDKVSIVVDANLNPVQYIYSKGTKTQYFDIDTSNESSYCEILHIKLENPLDEIYGLAPLYTARFSIDQYNEAIAWNKSLLENGARPSGALVFESQSGSGDLTDDQFDRLKNQLASQFSGGKNAGKVMVLEGGLRWQEMSINPKDMDFIQTKNSAARDIAIAFGIPANLLGIQGDNTYSNMSEARIGFWEDTVLPLTKFIYSRLQNFYNLSSQDACRVKLDTDSISALTEKREKMWGYVQASTFLTTNEKRNMLGFQSLQSSDNSKSYDSIQS
jgi:HK97 family phage portal protein